MGWRDADSFCLSRLANESGHSNTRFQNIGFKKKDPAISNPSTFFGNETSVTALLWRLPSLGRLDVSSNKFESLRAPWGEMVWVLSLLQSSASGMASHSSQPDQKQPGLRSL